MGTILAAMTGIIGASVTMMTALALPTMMKQGYSHALACGTIAAAGTLGILIPPSIMLIVMADLMSVSVGNLFSAAIIPGLSLAALYLLFIFLLAKLKPSLAPPLPPELLTVPKGKMVPLLWRAFFPPVFLIGTIKLSILLGWATPSEAGAVGAAGAIVLAALWGRLNLEDDERRLPERGAHHLDGVLHHHQRHLLRVRLPPARRRRHRRAPDQGGRPRAAGASCSW